METNYKEPLYTIGIAAKLLGVCPATLRIWEKNGLIKPKRLGKNRYYSKADLDQLEHVKKLIQKKGILSLNSFVLLILDLNIYGSTTEKQNMLYMFQLRERIENLLLENADIKVNVARLEERILLTAKNRIKNKNIDE